MILWKENTFYVAFYKTRATENSFKILRSDKAILFKKFNKTPIIVSFIKLH